MRATIHIDGRPGRPGVSCGQTSLGCSDLAEVPDSPSVEGGVAGGH